MPPQKLFKMAIGIAGSWYNDYFVFRYRIRSTSISSRFWWRLLMLPVALAISLSYRLRQQLVIPHVEFVISTRCNLNCMDCSNLIPFYATPFNFDVHQLLADIDEFLAIVDRVNRLILMGGETFLYPELITIIKRLVADPKVGIVHIFTNGTIIPDAAVFQVLTNPKVLVTVSNIPVENEKRRRLFSMMREQNINFLYDPCAPWIDLGGFSPFIDLSETSLENKFASCCRAKCHNILDGEYHRCPRSAHGARLGQFPKNVEDFVEIRSRQNRHEARRELIALITEKKYLAACGQCNGDKGKSIPPGIQAPRKQQGSPCK